MNSNSANGTWKIDSADRVIEIDENFELFCQQNRHFHFSGIKLGNFFHDALNCNQTTYLYRTLIYKARYTDEPINLEIRCDSPTERRWFEINMKRLPGSGTVKFTINKIKHEPRNDISLLKHNVPRTDDKVTICGVCGSVHHDGEWHDLEHFVDKKGLNYSHNQPKLKHSLCKDCLFKAISNNMYEPNYES